MKGLVPETLKYIFKFISDWCIMFINWMSVGFFECYILGFEYYIFEYWVFECYILEYLNIENVIYLRILDF